MWLGEGLPQGLGGAAASVEEPSAAALALIEVKAVSPSGIVAGHSGPTLPCPVVGLTASPLEALGALIRSHGQDGTALRRLITPFAVFDFSPDGPIVREVVHGLTAAELQANLATRLWAGSDLKELRSSS